jgi:NAD-dependent deacetylase
LFTGAGTSAESGLCTFRDNDGIWNNCDLNKVANLKNFVENQESICKFYNKFRTAVQHATLVNFIEKYKNGKNHFKNEM